jgi:hypothetical protein
MQIKSIGLVAITALAMAALSLGVAYSYFQQRGNVHEYLTNGYEYPRPFELLDVMHQFQRYADKIHASGQAKNARLVDWYAWKLEWASLQISEGQTAPYTGEYGDTRDMIKTMLVPTIKPVIDSAKAGDWDEFEGHYKVMVDACNACHIAAEHGFVKITVPTEPIYKNQDYSAVE